MVTPVMNSILICAFFILELKYLFVYNYLQTEIFINVGEPYQWYLTPTVIEMEDIFERIERRHREDILLIEKQLKMFEALTKKRMEMIKAIMQRQPTSIRDLANILDRDVKNVFDDLRLLNKMHIVALRREGRCVVPRVKKKIIIRSLG